ncbi:MAG TPA: YdeI/OmpD-associated family protein [Thermoanaerobaculia bacterium]|nr:YdeI/OmpD-associated family protein [Thermoanaerobaculia bacterium]
MEPHFFETPAAFRNWLEKNHSSASELLVGFHKRDSGKPSLTWPESVDQALCFGWIDGVRKRIDDVSYSIRFTPRKSASNWSAINIARVAELTKLGLMRPAGLRAFEQRREDESAIYAYENAVRTIEPADEKKFRANRKAWQFFNAQAPSYRRVCIFWVTSAKREETRARRLATLIDDSASGRRVGVVTLKPAKLSS